MRCRLKLYDALSVRNYKSIITDLIGVRALHLFKEDWIQINDFITSKWGLREKPIANIRKGDSDSFINEFKEKGCEIKEHIFGYRSVHYLVQSQPAKDMQVAEIQVRTIFEEGWSEIDHRTRYPYDMDNPILSQYLFIFNRLAGSADEMGSFVRLLKYKLDEIAKKSQESIEEKDNAINELREQIKKLKIEKKEKENLEAQIEALSKSSSFSLQGSVIAQPLDGLMGFSALGSQGTLGLAFVPTKCSKCGKEITDSSYAISSYPPLCSECRISTYTIIQNCSRCGKIITDPLASLTVPTLCVDCQSRGIFSTR
jgi:ppGpp synthetase/RelA/SpoT-type nucleotidyltranferase